MNPVSVYSSRLFHRLFCLNAFSIRISRIAIGWVLSVHFLYRLVSYGLAGGLQFTWWHTTLIEAGGIDLLQILFFFGTLALAFGVQRRPLFVFLWVLSVLIGVPHLGQMGYGYKILSCFMFWNMFLPQVDASGKYFDSGGSDQASIASLGLLLQLTFIYFSAGLTKDPHCWFVEASAMDTVLKMDLAGGWLAQIVAEIPYLMTFSTRAVFLLEMLTPVLLLSPVKTGSLRTFYALAIIGMHAGIALFMSISVFPYFCMALWLVVLPGSFWQWLERWLPILNVGDRKRVVQPMRVNWQLLLIVPILYIALTNVVQWEERGGGDFYMKLRRVGLYVGLDQQWIMFNRPCVVPEIPSAP